MSEAILIVALTFASWTDLRKGEIPIWLFPLAVIVIVLASDFHLRDERLITFAVTFLGLLLIGILGYVGGGDVIMLSCIALITGIAFINIALILTAVIMFFYIFTGCKNKEYPMAPFVLVAYIIYITWRCICIQ